VFYLDIDGAQDVTYEGPVSVSGIDVAGFQAHGKLQGHENDIVSSLLASLQQSFAGTGIRFTTDRPETDGSYSTIYLGGDDSAFAAYGPLLGLSEKIDTGNQDRSDNAFIFTDEIDMAGLTAAEFETELAGYVTHEVGHLLLHADLYRGSRLVSFADWIAFQEELDPILRDSLEWLARSLAGRILVPAEPLVMRAQGMVDRVRRRLPQAVRREALYGSISIPLADVFKVHEEVVRIRLSGDGLGKRLRLE